jgi:TonB family protein
MLCALVPLSTAAAPVPKAPQGKWVVNFDNAQCVASRNYGTLEAPLYLILKAPALGDVMHLAVLRRGYAGEPKHHDARVAVDDRRPIRTSLLAYSIKEHRQRMYRITLTPEQFAPITTARQLAVRSINLNENLALAGVAKVKKVLDECVQDLRKTWNVSEGEQLAPGLRAGPIGSLQGLIESEDYPGVSLDEMHSGSVTFALLIDEQGKIADCSVIGTSGAAALDAQSCAVVSKRARFKPAVGLDGKPAKSSLVQRITWRIE